MIRGSLHVRAIAALAAAMLSTSAAHAVPTFEQVSPVPTTYSFDLGDYRQFPNSSVADITAELRALAGDPLGCAATDFAGFVGGSVALIARGSCTFAQKLVNAAEAGAVGALVYNNVEGPAFGGFADVPMQLPAFSVGRDLGLSLVTALAAGPVVVRIRIEESDFPPALPEPAVWLQMILGFAAIGVALRATPGRRPSRA